MNIVALNGLLALVTLMILLALTALVALNGLVAQLALVALNGLVALMALAAQKISPRYSQDIPQILPKYPSDIL